MANKITEIDKRLERVETALALLKTGYSKERELECIGAWADIAFNVIEDLHFLLDRIEHLEKELSEEYQ